jgi:hypothetical protein
VNTLKINVGTLTLTESCNVELPQEFAAWHQTVRVDPGVYDVFAYIEWSDGGYRVRSLSAQCEGITISSYFRSHMLGEWGKSDNNRNGQRTTAHIQLPTAGRVGEASPVLAQANLCDVLMRAEWDAAIGRMWRFEWSPAAKPIVIEQARHNGGLSLAALEDHRRFTVDSTEMSAVELKALNLSFHDHTIHCADQLTVGETTHAYSFADKQYRNVTRLA